MKPFTRAFQFLERLKVPTGPRLSDKPSPRFDQLLRVGIRDRIRITTGSNRSEDAP
jgi:hypothetical protein